MKTLVIYSHPDTGGHCAAILKETKEFLKQKNVDFEVLDLYKIKYDPVLHEEEHYTRSNRYVSKQNLEMQEKIKAADNMIFIYPVWWGTMPAIMKGFFDRVFTAGFSFKYENGIPRGLLKGKSALVFMTSGSPLLLSKIFQGGRPQKSVRHDILGFCGVKSTVCQIGSSMKFDDARAGMIKRAVAGALKKFL